MTSRASRFTPTKHLVTVPSTTERVTREERRRREVALELEMTGPSSTAFMKTHDLKFDQEVRTDVVRGVSVETGAWTVRWTIAEQDGVLVARSVHLEPTGASTPAGGITSDLLRELSPAAAIAAANSPSPDDEPALLGTIMKWHTDQRSQHGPSAPAPEISRRRPGRKPIPESALVEVALMYLHEQANGRGVHARMAKRLHLTESAVRDRIRMCRDPERGLLTQTKQGKRGGGAGPRLIEMRADLASRAGEGS